MKKYYNKFKNLFIKKDFKELIELIKDKDLAIKEKIKHIENILNNTPKLVNDKDSRNGDTLLHYAINTDHSQCGSNKIIELLLNKDADPNAKNRCGQTPLHYIMSKFECYIVPDMEDYSKGKYDNKPELVEDSYVVVSQKNVNSKHSELNLNVDDTFFQLIGFFFEKGADVNIKDCYKQNPLDVIKESTFFDLFYNNLCNKTNEVFQRILRYIEKENLQNLDNTKIQIVNRESLNNDGPSNDINAVEVLPCNSKSFIQQR